MASVRTLAALVCLVLAVSLPVALAERQLKYAQIPPCCAFQKCAGHEALYNPQLSLYGNFLTGFLGYGSRRLQTSWCGSGGSPSVTILAPNNDAVRAAFKKLQPPYGNNPFPKNYVNENPEASPFNAPLYRVIDALTTVHIIKGAIDFYTDSRWKKPCADPTKCGVTLPATGYGDAFTYNTKVVVFRSTNGAIYADLQGELLPGAGRIRIFQNKRTFYSYGFTFVYAVNTMWAPTVVPTATQYGPAAPGGLDSQTSLAEILKTIGPSSTIPYPCGIAVTPNYPAKLCVGPIFPSGYSLKVKAFGQCGGAGGECSVNSYAKPCVKTKWPGVVCTEPGQTCVDTSGYYRQCKP